MALVFPDRFRAECILKALGFDSSAYSDFLYYYANAEFNNGSGLFGPFIDFGIAGGAVCWLVLGIVSGSLFRSYVAGGLWGLIIYPSWYTSIIEIPRISTLVTRDTFQHWPSAWA